MYQGRPQGVSGLNAVVSWPAEEWGRDPAGFAEMRPGVYDVHERVRDMNRNGILASMCFPTFTGFSARHLNMHREDVTLVMVSAYNDWHIDEWAGSYPDRFIPIAVLPTWNPEAMCAEIRRVAAKGCRAVTMPELPHLEGLPSYHDDEYWGPVFRTLSEENVVMCLHIGTGFGAISMAPNAPIDNLIILATQVSAMCAQDLLWGPAMRNYPGSEVRVLRGRHRLDPVLSGSQRPALHQPEVAAPRLRRQAAQRRVPRALAGLLCHRQDVAEAAARDRHRHHRLGVRLPALGLLLARRARAGACRAERRGRRRQRHQQDHLGRTPAGSSAGIRSPARPRSRRTSVRCAPRRPTSTCRSGRARSGRACYAEKQLAKA